MLKGEILKTRGVRTVPRLLSFSISAVNVSETPLVGSVTFVLKTSIVIPCTVEPGHNDISLYDT
jgi:hypothetical protein